MKHFSALFIFAALLLLTACATSCPCRRGGPAGQEVSGELRLFVLPSLECRTADEPPRPVFIAASLGYRGDAAGLELANLSVQAGEAVCAALEARRARELDSVEGYEALRRGILMRINGMLSSGRVERVVIRNLSVR